MDRSAVTAPWSGKAVQVRVAGRSRAVFAGVVERGLGSVRPSRLLARARDDAVRPVRKIESLRLAKVKPEPPRQPREAGTRQRS